MLSTKNLKQDRLNKKLAYRLLGPFTIDEPVGLQVYRLHLPSIQRIHPTFYVSLLELYHQRDTATDILNTEPPILLDDEPIQEVKEVLQRKTKKGKVYYLVKQKGWTEDYNKQVESKDI